MTTQQDSVDVERAAIVAYLEACAIEADRQADLLSVAGRARAIEACQEEAKAYRNSARMIRNEDHASYRRKVDALTLPITQRDEQASRRAEAALSVAEMLVPFTTHNIGCAVYQRSYAGGSPVCTCGVEAGREAVTAIRRLSIEQGDQDGGEG